MPIGLSFLMMLSDMSRIEVCGYSEFSRKKFLSPREMFSMHSKRNSKLSAVNLIFEHFV